MFEHEELPLATLRLRRETSGELLKACRGRVFELEDEIVALDVQIAEREGSDAFGFSRVGSDRAVSEAKSGVSLAWADNAQAAEIDALVERAGRLTDAEIDALGAAGAAAWYAAWDAARYAAWGAARGAAWYAARGAAWGAAYNASWRVAPHAAWHAGASSAALVVRDLIDEATDWNQAAYDLLTGPWASVVGPTHPDDVAVQ